MSETLTPDRRGVGLYPPCPPEKRKVGLAYTTWFRRENYPWGTRTWDIPLLGPYASDNRDVIRQHGLWLADAGVDFVFVDWSNNIGYVPETMREVREDFRMIEESVIDLFEVWAEIPGAPKIAIFSGPGHNGRECFTNGQCKKKTDQIWDTFIANEKYNKMYFYYEGKPFLPCYAATPSIITADEIVPWDDDRFTIRWITGYVGQQRDLHDPETLRSYRHWSWEERGTQTFTVNSDGQPEAMSIVASWRQQGKPGERGYIPAQGRNNGETFRTQFARAREIGVEFAMIISWNEWNKGEQHSAEISKDLEPSQIHGTFYLDLMKEEIAKFKKG